MEKTIVKKAFVNKKTNQMSISIPRKKLPSKLRYSDDLFFEIKAFSKARGK